MQFLKKVKRFVWVIFTLNQIYDLLLREINRLESSRHLNPLNKFGRKVFSQTDEDGITLEIVRRLGLGPGSLYAEFGVGNGLENNTLVLAASGWRGVWVGGEDLAFEVSKGKRFAYFKEWITRDNIAGLTQNGLKFLGAERFDLISLDLDGNDIYFVEQILSKGLGPKVFIVEYNGKFPPPIKFQIDYDEKHTWRDDDYFGASLSSYVEMFAKHGYRLVCCNSSSGLNAFFVANEFSNRFVDVPAEIEKLYVEPRYFLYQRYGHRSSPKLVAKFLSDN